MSWGIDSKGLVPFSLWPRLGFSGFKHPQNASNIKCLRFYYMFFSIIYYICLFLYLYFPPEMYFPHLILYPAASCVFLFWLFQTFFGKRSFYRINSQIRHLISFKTPFLKHGLRTVCTNNVWKFPDLSDASVVSTAWWIIRSFSPCLRTDVFIRLLILSSPGGTVMTLIANYSMHDKPAAVLSALWRLFCLIFTAILGSRYYDYACFVDEAAKTQSGEVICSFLEALSGRLVLNQFQ